jgi:hypothetical protein
MPRLAALVLLSVLTAIEGWAQSGYGKALSFSGFTWLAKISTGRVGPGPNWFSQNNVWTDAKGLHLKISRSGSKWYCGEVVLQNWLGYGTYRFYVDSPLDNLDPYVVLGLFTWNDDPAYNHRELDIEFSRWGAAANPSGWYTVQPYGTPGNQTSFVQPSDTPQSTHMFDWFHDASGNRSVHFSSVKGLDAAGPLIFEHTFNSGVPPTGNENVRINLWLFQGHAPTNRSPVEIVINKFEFIPQPPI